MRSYRQVLLVLAVILSACSVSLSDIVLFDDHIDVQQKTETRHLSMGTDLEF